MVDVSGRRSTLVIIGEAFVQTVEFAADLFKLARAEMGEALSLFGRVAIMMVAAAIGLLLAVVFLLIGVAHFLILHAVSPDLAYVLVGGVLALISIIVALKARADAAAGGFTPHRTIEQFESFMRTARRANSDGR